MNKLQKNYLTAKNNYHDARESANETTDRLGLLQQMRHEMKNDAEFDRQLEIACSIDDFFCVNELEEQFKQAEAALLKWGFDVALNLPEAKAHLGDLKELQAHCEKNYTTRLKVIDLVMRLDTRKQPRKRR